MAERRMFAKTIIDSDMFLEMSLSAQALYFHLAMHADDEGFLNNSKKIMRAIGANQNDYDLLIAKQFILQFDEGICVIKHWRIHNYIQKDRFKPTIYQDERSLLMTKENKSYAFQRDIKKIPMDTDCIQRGYSLRTQVRSGKERLNKERQEYMNYSDAIESYVPSNVKNRYGDYHHIELKDSELQDLNGEYGELETKEAIKFLDEYIEMSGKKYGSHYLVLKKWVYDAVKEQKQKKQQQAIPQYEHSNRNKFINYQQRAYTKEDFFVMEQHLVQH
ncbi:DNA replication protein, putative [Lachnospiraceae bacterium KM106-2]|nr:DNA replication protein, putative [Lachnospiraceae bacterium KM106-2]